MALSFPYALSFLNDLLQPTDIDLRLRENLEYSGSGDGRMWASQLSLPLWTAEIALGFQFVAQSREIDAKIRALGEGRQTFLFNDPTFWPAGGAYPGTGVTISSIHTDRDRIAVTGLPASYRIHPGDRFSILYGGKYFFAEFVEGTNIAPANPDTPKPPVSAVTPSLTTAQLAINPYLPLSITTGMAVEMWKPVIKMVVAPGGYTPFNSKRGPIRQGAALSLVQKV